MADLLTINKKHKVLTFENAFDDTGYLEILIECAHRQESDINIYLTKRDIESIVAHLSLVLAEDKPNDYIQLGKTEHTTMMVAPIKAIEPFNSHDQMTFVLFKNHRGLLGWCRKDFGFHEGDGCYVISEHGSMNAVVEALKLYNK